MLRRFGANVLLAGLLTKGLTEALFFLNLTLQSIGSSDWDGQECPPGKAVDTSGHSVPLDLCPDVAAGMVFALRVTEVGPVWKELQTSYFCLRMH